MLNIDYTLFIQIANFLFLLFILNLILYRPIRRVLRQRHAEMDSLEHDTSSFETKAADCLHQLEESVAGARREGAAQKESIRVSGVEQERGILRKAANAAGDKMSQARGDIEKELIAARQSLEDEVAGFSKELAQKILGRSV
jgi:F-type H+-transporting ATPase subunit b